MRRSYLVRLYYWKSKVSEQAYNEMLKLKEMANGKFVVDMRNSGVDPHEYHIGTNKELYVSFGKGVPYPAEYLYNKCLAYMNSDAEK